MYIQEKTSDELPMATYIPFLALLAFKIFAAEQVDVAIMEVGLGGKYDATNVVQIPIVCGISSLGYDHMEILGAEACNTDQACEEVKDDSGICVRSCQNSSVFSSLPLAIKWLRDAAQKDRFVRCQVLVTGSLYLVGDVLRLIKK